MPTPTKKIGTIQKRIPREDAEKIQQIADRLGLTFADAFGRCFGRDLDKVHRRMKESSRFELGENGGA